MTTTTTIPADMTDSLASLGLIGIAIAMIVAAVVLYLVVRMMVTLANLTRPTEIVVVMILGLITLVTILSYSVTELEDLGVVAGTGIGAIAGAVTSLYTRKGKDDGGTEQDDGPDT